MLKQKYIIIVSFFFLFACSSHKQISESVQSGSIKHSSDPIHVQATDLILEGKRAELQANFVLAEDYYLKCLKTDPSNSTAYYLLGRIYKTKNPEKALSFTQKAVELDPTEPYFQDQLILIYKQMKDWDNAAKIIKTKIDQNSLNKANYYELANAFIYNNQINKALNVYDDFEKKFGIDEGIILQKKQIYLNQKNFAKAVVEVEKLITLKPEKLDYLGMAADIYQAMGEKDKAFEYYSRILQMNPEDGKVHLSLADYYYLQGKREEAYNEIKYAVGSTNLAIDAKIPVIFKTINESVKNEKAYKQSQELTELLVKTHPNDAKAFATQADFYNLNGNFFEARESYRKVVQMDSSKYLVWEQLILLEKEFADFPMMLIESEKALKMFSQYSILYYFNALANFKMGNYSVAEESLDAGKMFCYSPRQQSDFFVLSAQLNFLKDRKDIAQKYLQSAIDLDPKCSSAHRVAAGFLETSDEAEELNLLFKALATDSLNADNYFAIAKYYQKKNNISESVIYLRNAQKLMPFRVDYIELEGDLYLVQNRNSEAIEAWKKALKYSDYRKTEIETKIINYGSR